MDGKELENEIAKLLLRGKRCENCDYYHAIYSDNQLNCSREERLDLDYLPEVGVCELWT